MRISVFGLGYVGVVSAGCLAADGNHVVGVDPMRTKVDLVNEGRTPIIEPDLGTILHDAVKAGRLTATSDEVAAIRDTELSIICVGTPSLPNGGLDLHYVRRVCEQIGSALRTKSTWHVVCVRSTMLPGSMRNVVIPTLEEWSGKRAGVDFGVCINPEFLREGTAVADYKNPPKTVIGEIDARSGDLVASLYVNIVAPLVRAALETAEMVKYSDNVFHALKIGFANEIGNVCKALGIDSHEVMEIFCKDTKLNLSPYYLKPGFAFGGSCLGKDVRAMLYKAKALDLELPILAAILPSNERQIDRGVRMVVDQGRRKVGVLGFSFKAGTDDLRESPVVELIERLLGKGYELRLFDKNVSLAGLVGANRDFILNHIPHISRLMVETENDVLDFAETVVVGNGAPEFSGVLQRLRPEQALIDLVRTTGSTSRDNYNGICW